MNGNRGKNRRLARHPSIRIDERDSQFSLRTLRQNPSVSS